MNKQQLAAKIWQSANKMRSKIEANDYKDYILGFVFYKFLSEKQIKALKSKDFGDSEIQNLSEDDLDIVKYTQGLCGYFIAYEHLFSTWIGKGKDFDVSNVRDALSAFSRLIAPENKKVYDKIFNTLETGLSRLGDDARKQTRAISDLIHLIDDIPMDGRQDYDVLGFIYEYLIGMFAANAGKKAGEFYTPQEVSVLMSEIIAHHLKAEDKIKIYDPTSGSGSLLINIGRAVARHGHLKDNILYYAQELKENTYNLTRMNLVMRDINPSNITTRNADTLEDDWPMFDDNDPIGTYQHLYVDAVVSNPPYSQMWDSTHKESDPRYAGFGLAPKSKADFAFLLHDLYHLKPKGIMAIVLPHGVLFRGGEEAAIRRNLIEKNHIDTIIGLPANVFFGTGIPTIIMILRQKREHSDVLFIDASKGFSKEGKQNKLQAGHIKKIVDTFIERKDTPKYARKVAQAEIREQGYNLNIPRYIDSSATAETYDIHAILHGGIPQAEIDLLADYWQALPSLRHDLFAAAHPGYGCLKTDNIAHTIAANADVQSLEHTIQAAFADFESHLHQALIAPLSTEWESQNIAQIESRLSSNIFKRLTHIPLIDPYASYQQFANHWQAIAQDWEIIQSEGKAAITQANPNIVMTKKDGKEIEKQEGYIGHILPFALVQQHHLQAELSALEAQEQRLADIGAELESLLENLSEEDKSSAAINENGDGFIAAEINKALQAELAAEHGPLSKAEFAEQLAKHVFAPDSLAHTLRTAQGLLEAEKSTKAAIKKQSAAIHLHTKTTLETLSHEQAEALLAEKWISPLLQAMDEQAHSALQTLAAKIRHLADKYAQSLLDTDAQLQQAEQNLAAMLGGLTGSQNDMQGIAAWQKLLGAGQ